MIDALSLKGRGETVGPSAEARPVAAFPPPELRLSLPEPLRTVARWARRSWPFDKRFADEPLTVIASLHQLEQFLNGIRRHRGPVRLGGDLSGLHWYSPHDALNYFADWRREIAVAVSQVAEPAFYDPKWLSGDVVALRDAIEGQRAFDRLPILADALEEAGCQNLVILTHLREPSDHAHHCWVVDLLSCGQPVSADI